MENASATRNQILTELIGKMNSRLADKAYPDEKLEEKADEPKEDAPVEVVAVEAPKEDADDMSDSDIDEILKSC